MVTMCEAANSMEDKVMGVAIDSIECTLDKVENSGGKALAATLMEFDNDKGKEESVAECRSMDADQDAIGSRGRNLVIEDAILFDDALSEKLEEISLHGEKDY